MADEHKAAAHKEDVPASELFDNVEGDWCRTDIDQCSDELDQKRVGDGAKRREEDHPEIQDEINALDGIQHLSVSCTELQGDEETYSKLLHHL